MHGLLHSYDIFKNLFSNVKNVKLQNKETKNITDNSTNYKSRIIPRPWRWYL